MKKFNYILILITACVLLYGFGRQYITRPKEPSEPTHIVDPYVNSSDIESMYVLIENQPAYFDARIIRKADYPYFYVSKKKELVELLEKMELPVDKFRQSAPG